MSANTQRWIRFGTVSGVGYVLLRLVFDLLVHSRDARAIFTIVSSVLIAGVAAVVLWKVFRNAGAAAENTKASPGAGTRPNQQGSASKPES